MNDKLQKEYDTLGSRLEALKKYRQETGAPLAGQARGYAEDPRTGITALANMFANEQSLISQQSGVRKEMTQQDQFEREMGFKEKELGLKYGTETSGAEQVKLKGASQTNAAFWGSVYNTAKKALEGWKKEYSGLLDTLAGTGRIALNKEGSGEEATFRQTLKSAVADLRNKIAGATLTPEEKKELYDLLPKITDSDSAIVSKINGLMGRASTNTQSILGSAGYYDVDSNEYLELLGGSKLGGTVKLTSPSGEVYEWEKGDPEIEEARKAGWK